MSTKETLKAEEAFAFRENKTKQNKTQWLALPPHSEKVEGSIPEPGSLHVLPVSAWVLSGFSGLLLPTIVEHASKVNWDLFAL